VALKDSHTYKPIQPEGVFAVDVIHTERTNLSAVMTLVNTAASSLSLKQPYSSVTGW